MAERKPKVAPVAPDGTLNYTSVSAIKKHAECPRKWWFRYVKRLEEGTSAGAILGTQCHARTEKYLTTGIEVLGDIERAGLWMMPKPGKDLLVEENFSPEFPLFAAGVPMAGFIDLINPRPDAHPVPHVLPVTDWKFKKDLAKYGASAADLLEPTNEDGIQMIGYGAWVAFNRSRFPGVEAVEVQHGNFQTTMVNGRYPTKLVKARIQPLAFFESAWETVSQNQVEAMKVTAKAKEASEVQPNTKACWKYGGCSFRHVCPLGKDDGLMASMADAFRPSKADEEKEQTVGLLDDMDDVVAEAPKAAKADTKKEAPPKRSLITDETGAPDKEVQAAVGNAPSAQEIKVAEAVQASHKRLGLPPHKATEELLARAKADPAAIKPPDAPKSDPKLAAKVDPVAVTEFPKPPAEAPKQSATEEAPAKPKKEKKAKASQGSDVATSAETSAEQPPAQAPTRTMVAAGRTQGITLWIGTAPYRPLYAAEAPQTLNAYVARMEAETLKKFTEKGLPQLSDIRMSFGEAIGFGKWKGYLAAHVKGNLPEAGDYVVLPGDERVDTVMHALLDSGAQVGGIR